MNHSNGVAAIASGPVLLLLFGGVFLGALDIAIVGPALPAIEAELALGSRQSAAIFSVYILFALLSAPLLASLSDRLGRRKVYVACLMAFGVGSALVAMAGSIEVLLIGRAIQAMGAGGTLPVASAVIADTFPVERRGRALGIIGAVFGLAFVIGPLIGSLFLQWSWRWLFVVNLPLCVVLIGASVVLLEDRRAEGQWQFDWSGTILLALGLAILVAGATRLTDGSPGLIGISYVAVVAFIVAGGLLVAFWRVECRAASPVIQPALLRSLQMRVICVLGLATGLIEASMVFLPTLAVSALDVSPSRASFMLAPLIAALIAGSILAGALLDRVGVKPVILFGMALAIVGLLLFSGLPLSTASFYGAGISVGFGLASLLGAPLRYAALEEGGAADRGASQGLLTVCLGVGRLFGASLTGGIAAGAANAVLGYRRAMLVIAIAAALALLTGFRLRSR